jgi:geranylgeranyl diphosphate synthase type II
MRNEFKARLSMDQEAVEARLKTLFLDDGCGTLNESMRYSLLAGGKRIRPVLTLAFSRLFGGEDEPALTAGISIEMVHTYSLIHDDLPCMDNDDLRRGKPTSHMVFGEAGAVLAGDALLTEAFSNLCRVNLPPERLIRLVEVLSECSGAEGMVGGQILDLDAELVPPDKDGVEKIQNLKTGALIRAACQMGVICADGDREAMHAAAQFAEHLGRAFQIRDDLLDAEGSEEKLGKKTGMDGNKTTFLSLFGAQWCRDEILRRTQSACFSIRSYSGSDYLCELAETLAVRDH